MGPQLVIITGNSVYSIYEHDLLAGNYFLRYSDQRTPFDSGLDETVIEEDILANELMISEDSDDDEPEELRKDFVDEYVEENPEKQRERRHSSKAPILTNTTLTVLRQIGRYIQMSRLLQPIACDVITCMLQLFEFYLFAVHQFFASDLVRNIQKLFRS